MPQYKPQETLPIYKTFSTVMINGVTYKSHLETDWNQVITEDGITLAELLANNNTSPDNQYVFKGLLVDKPDMSAMDQLYSIIDQKTGDIWLVQTQYTNGSTRVYEMYSWGTNLTGWVYCGTTNKRESIINELPNVIQLFPKNLGSPNQVLIIDQDGKSLTWGMSSEEYLQAHNIDAMSHQDIRNEISRIKGSDMAIFNDIIPIEGWTYNSVFPCFEYVYKNSKLGPQTYFEITPIYINNAESAKILGIGLYNIFEIITPADSNSYAILRAKKVPKESFNICVKAYVNFSNR